MVLLVKASKTTSYQSWGDVGGRGNLLVQRRTGSGIAKNKSALHQLAYGAVDLLPFRILLLTGSPTVVAALTFDPSRAAPQHHEGDSRMKEAVKHVIAAAQTLEEILRDFDSVVSITAAEAARGITPAEWPILCKRVLAATGNTAVSPPPSPVPSSSSRSGASPLPSSAEASMSPVRSNSSRPERHNDSLVFASAQAAIDADGTAAADEGIDSNDQEAPTLPCATSDVGGKLGKHKKGAPPAAARGEHQHAVTDAAAVEVHAVTATEAPSRESTVDPVTPPAAPPAEQPGAAVGAAESSSPSTGAASGFDTEVALQKEVQTNDEQREQLKAQMARAKALVAAVATKRNKLVVDGMVRDESDERKLISYKQAVEFSRLVNGTHRSWPSTQSTGDSSGSGPAPETQPVDDAAADLEADPAPVTITSSEAVARSVQAVAASAAAVMATAETQLRTNLAAAHDVAQRTLEAHTPVVNNVQMQAASIALDMQRLIQEEVEARAKLFADALGELQQSATALAKEAAAAVIASYLNAATPDACVDIESKLRMAIEAEELARRKAFELGEAAARKAQYAADLAKEYIHRVINGESAADATTLDEVLRYETVIRQRLEGRADRALQRMYRFELPADDDAREKLFGEVEGYLAKLATKAIRIFVSSLSDPAQAVATFKKTLAEETPEAARLSISVLRETAVHGPPDPLREKILTLKQAALEVLPAKAGANEEQAAVVAVVADQVLDRACVAAVDFTKDEAAAAQRCQMMCCVM